MTIPNPLDCRRPSAGIESEALDRSPLKRAEATIGHCRVGLEAIVTCSQVFGLVAITVNRPTRDIDVSKSLGATPSNVVALIVGSADPGGSLRPE